MVIDQQKTIRTLRLSLTCILLFFITWYFEVPEYSWTLITIWFVMFEYTTVGGVFTKGKLRFLGTFFSAAYGLIIIYFCGNNAVVNMLALIPGLFVYAYFFMVGDKVYVGTIGATTLTIVLFNYNDIDLALLRLFNIMIGITGAMFMIRFFYPQFAKDKLIEVELDLIKLFSHILDNYLDETISLAMLKKDYLAHEHKFIDLFSLFQRYVMEATIETRRMPQLIPCQLDVIGHIRHLFRLFSVFVYYLTTDSMRKDPYIRENLALLLSAFRDMEQILNYGEIRGEQCLLVTGDIEPHEFSENMQNSVAISTVLTTMRQEAFLLDQNIKKIRLMYRG